MFGTFYTPPAGECRECGRVHTLSTGTAEKNATDVGETFPSNYCCKNCLDEHGPTPHVRVPAGGA